MNLATEGADLVALRPQWPQQSETRIGSLLIDAGKLSIADAERVLRAQKERGLRFGEAAIALGLVTEQDIQQVLSLQFSHPTLTPGESAVSPEVITAYQGSSPAVETFRAIRSQLMVRWFADAPTKKPLAIVSASRREGRSYVCANLGVVFSQLGERTLIIDANMHHPTQHKLFGLENQSGLSAILADRAGRDVVQRVPELRDLFVLSAGATPPNPQDLLARPTFLALLEDLNSYYDVVLLDTPAGVTADVDVIAARAGGAVLVAARNRVRVREAKHLVTRLRDVKCQVVGGVINDR